MTSEPEEDNEEGQGGNKGQRDPEEGERFQIRSKVCGGDMGKRSWEYSMGDTTGTDWTGKLCQRAEK